MMYLGRSFNDVEEIKEFNKQGNVNFYKKLAKRFASNPTMETSVAMTKLADILVNIHGMTYSELEAIEIAAYAE